MNTILDLLRDQARREPDSPAIYTRLTPTTTNWISLTWKEVWDRVIALSIGFKARGLESGDRLAIIAPNGLEWELAHFAALASGAIVIGLDGHDTGERLRKILLHAKVNALVVGGHKILSKLGTSTQAAKFILSISRTKGIEALPAALTWDEVMKAPFVGNKVPAPFPKKDDPATIIYTSGTTGEPKGILYSHGQLVLACEAIIAALPAGRPGARFVCWLPLSNLFQRVMNLCAVATGSSLYMVADPHKVLDFVQEIEPDVFIGVPRFYEKLALGIKQELAAETGVKAALAQFALAIGRRYAAVTKNPGGKPTVALQLQYFLADRLVLRRLRGLFGTRLQYLISGSAPIPLWILEFFESFGCLILEAYGLSENILPIAMNAPNAYRFGTVGKVMPQNEIRIDEDSELLVRGPGLFNGYFGDPESFERVSKDGFYRTGDYGHFDDAGFLKLTGRKSEIIKTSSGRRIALPAIESVLRELSWVDHAVVLGSGQKCLAALLTLGSSAEGMPTLSPALRAELVAHINAKLSRHEQPTAALILARPFTVDGGELTPNLKLRRAEIERKYATATDRLFQTLDQMAQGSEPEQFLIEFHE